MMRTSPSTRQPHPYDDDADASYDLIEPIDEWTLDDLDRSADLSSLRTAWAAADERDA